MEKMTSELFYNMRYLKTFKDLTNSDGAVWRWRWPDRFSIEIYNINTNEILCTVESPHIAEYICALNNTSHKFVKEIESKYV